MSFMMNHQKYRFNILLFLTPVLAVALAGCTMGFVDTAAKTGGTHKASSNSNTVFNSDWILNQQERHSEDENIREGYSIVKTTASFNQNGFTGLNSSVVGIQDLHDGYKYFLIKTEADAAQFRTEVRTSNPEQPAEEHSVQETAILPMILKQTSPIGVLRQQVLLKPLNATMRMRQYIRFLQLLSIPA